MYFILSKLFDRSKNEKIGQNAYINTYKISENDLMIINIFIIFGIHDFSLVAKMIKLPDDVTVGRVSLESVDENKIKEIDIGNQYEKVSNSNDNIILCETVCNKNTDCVTKFIIKNYSL